MGNTYTKIAETKNEWQRQVSGGITEQNKHNPSVQKYVIHVTVLNPIGS